MPRCAMLASKARAKAGLASWAWRASRVMVDEALRNVTRSCTWPAASESSCWSTRRPWAAEAWLKPEHAPSEPMQHTAVISSASSESPSDARTDCVMASVSAAVHSAGSALWPLRVISAATGLRTGRPPFKHTSPSGHRWSVCLELAFDAMKKPCGTRWHSCRETQEKQE
eukprot:3096917-Rhodomonas_salina.1